MTGFSSSLNPEQYAAATAPDGPVLVLAAAGTGKTTTLVHRVAFLAGRGVPADRILLLTFTNRAAREMLERAQRLSGDAVSQIWSGTFHSICARMLRRFGATLGYTPSFAILDEDDQKRLVGEIVKEKVGDPKSFPKKEVVLRMITEAANERKPVGFVAARWQTKASGFSPEQIEAIAETYAARKRELNAMDFDDLLVNGLALLRTSDGVREMLQERFLHVLVDEYQDTNGLQAEFSDILASRHRSIFAVGDDFQCIYTWRGAQIDNILRFPERWNGCRIVKLERNYRSLPGILDVANAVMKDSPRQFEKTLRPARGAGGPLPTLNRVYDGASQAAEIVRLVREARELGYRYGDMAVLYRSHFQSIDVQMTLARAMLPFRITSGVGVFEQVHVKDVLSYLRIIVNPSDELSFRRFVTLLPGVGEAASRKFWDRLGGRFDPSRREDRDALGAMLGRKASPLWPAISRSFEGAAARLANGETGELAVDFVNFFYEDYARGRWEGDEADDRLADIQELASQIADSQNGLEGFLQDVALMTNLDASRNSPSADSLTLSTIHQAKGMEWPVVFVPWCSEGLFPSSKAVEEGRIDEERRLFYVVVTRAKDSLHLFSPQMRKMADGGMYPVDASTFVKDVPAGLLDVRRPVSFAGGGSYGSCGRPSQYRHSGRGAGRGGAGAYRTTWRR